MKSKNELRKEIFEKRAHLSQEYRHAAEERIYQQLFNLEQYQNAKKIMVYYSTDEELNTHPIIQRAWQDQKEVGIPRVFPERVMEAMIYKENTPLERSAFGILEPEKIGKRLVPEEIDLIIMPCVTCNNKGERLGYGGGYYDRFLLRAKNAYLVLPYYAKLQTDEIPTEEHDKKVDMILTEEGISLIK
ncbi:5-formyltetrahydrofolate cyclo-ligase [Facklamia miroungae]|uniref:5-formyltetrahydrofolate cyclo-ligase n=1 Tax=Facklamia miroungae TaxID=120956 RepID=A0A1G7P6B4_9LACT|nr:5-formyltetrahydrofolate cyclo-ligase [Facklamia miroungae]NKZ28595.1 5-formyltetrahydrofolate cyclo-ligase [Facklamia miroungae]SDF81774.1 5-formyltetrahydrofolate cyclo-ligase [Facklamia miroungae]